jgi:hypothetical protein
MFKSRRMRWEGNVARMGANRNASKSYVVKAEGKRPIRRARCRWEDNAKMGLAEIRSGGKDWIHMAMDRNQWRVLVNAVMNLP